MKKKASRPDPLKWAQKPFTIKMRIFYLTSPKERIVMAKRKTLPPLRKPKRDEGNPKALQITGVAVGVVVLLLVALIVFVNN